MIRNRTKWRKKYYLLNRDKESKYHKLKYLENPEKFKRTSRLYKQKNKQSVKDYIRKYKYGLSKQEFESLLFLQNHRCCICKSFLSKPFVDHSHKTGKVRGLLCRNCNTFIGFAKESKQTLRSAIKYLRKHE